MNETFCKKTRLVKNSFKGMHWAALFLLSVLTHLLEIKMIRLATMITKEEIDYKAGAFADDVGVVLCGGD